MAGKDTFILTRNTVKALNKWVGVKGEPKGKKARRNVQLVFNDWAAESGLGLAQMSRILAASVD